MANTYEPVKAEPEILKFWKENKIWEQAKQKNSGKKKFYFLQGPPYTSGKLHMGHAWNNSIKDFVLRYKRMAGFDVWDRAGYDMHGLPTEHKVMAKFGLKDKFDIEKFGIAQFNNECRKWCTETAKVMDEDLRRLGIWMDFENAYYPITTTYIEGEWWLIKQAHEKNRLYEGLRTLSWCANCQTALAKHEQLYENVTDNSIFLKFPVKGKKNEFLVIWTTTPWTIAFNLAVMVNPELEYVRAQVEDEVWILSKGLAGPVVMSVANKNLKIIEEFKGEKLEGLEYEHPWENEISEFKDLKKKHPKLHTVILSEEYVDLSAGTGLVHCAPGCGPEDYEVGYKNNLPPYNTIDQKGIFPKEMGKFSGWVAKVDDAKFIKELESTGMLIATTPVEHDYAHCERCHKPVVFRTTKQWFFKVEDLKPKMIEANEKITWVPENGKNSFKSWLTHLRDNSITKQRYWGTPVPIWRCSKCGKYEVIGSTVELKEKAGRVPEDLHKPWIDEITIPCKCGSKMTRLPDVLDVWIDAGTASWNCLDYPKRKDLFNKWFPVDFILEAKEQIRGWFNLLMVASTIGMDNPLPFKACYMHGMLTDVDGVKMSKSLGNVISPYEIIDKYGVDTLRTYVSITPAGEDMNFSWDEIKIKNRNLSVLWNVHNFILELAKETGKDPYRLNEAQLSKYYGFEEKYIFSRLHSAIKRQTEYFDQYLIDKAPSNVEDFYLELSRTYIQLIRDKVSVGEDIEKEVVLSTLGISFLEILKMFAPIAPFITEIMYQDFRTAFNLKPESIHLCPWSKFDEKRINPSLETKFGICQNLIQAVLAARDILKIGLRWPLKEIVVATNNKEVIIAIGELTDLLKNQTNVKVINVREKLDGVKEIVKPDYSKINPEFKRLSPKIIANLTTTSQETVLKHIKEFGSYKINVDGTEVNINMNHLIITREIPAPYSATDFKYGILYVNQDRDKNLEGEGFSRELMRRVQNLRKTSGLNKVDTIKLVIKADKELTEMFKKHADLIKEKCGAKSLDFVSVITFKDVAKEKVKDKEFEIGILKI